MTLDADDRGSSLEPTAPPHAPQRTPEYFKSILAAGTTLENVARAKIAMDAEDPATRTLAAEYYPILWKKYKDDAHTNRKRYIVSCFFGQHAAWAIVLFSDGKIDRDYPVETANLVAAEWERLVSKCCAAIDEVAMVVGRRQKKVICARLFALLHTLFSAIDVAVSLHKQGSGMTGDRLDKTLTYVQDDIEEVSQNIRDLAIQTDRRVAQQQYLIGMLPGLMIVAAMIVAARWLHPLGVTISYLRVVLGGGALGALLSVLVRTTSAQPSKPLQVDTQAGTPLIVSAGAFRPIVGALLALAVYVLIEAGLIPIKIPGQPQDLWFVSAISFLAGFTERFAQDALVNTSRATFGSGRAEEPPDLPS